MYIPAGFLVEDPAQLQEFMRRYSFATLVSQHDGAPFATHLPMLLEQESAPPERLIGHVARANPQWRSADGQRVLVIFQGPHAYVSPGWMEARNVVPTWNYVAVHAYGTLRLIEDPERLLQIVRRTVDVYESGRPEPWSVDQPDAEFISNLLTAIVGLEIDIDRLEGKWKLNQNHPPERRGRIMEGLQQTGRHEELQIAELMARSIG
jgi:transcriptional regulator